MKNCPVCHLTYPNEFTLCPHDGGTLESKDQWSPGMVVREKYRIIGPIGAGGMATVYKAEHIHFREIRALKVISPALSGDDGFVRRFMQEAVLTRRLHHPNAVRVDDIDRGEDGRPFIVMEFIDGICLRDAMRPQIPMPIERACRIAKQVASALGAAHDLGMVHRDIKPHNIFLANTYSPATRAVDGEQAKVLDFGIAKVKESQIEDTRLRNLTMTGAGAVIGTPAYMSPEQAAGKRGDDLDGRSDLYSLGVVLYQMLTGDLPLNADSEMQLMMAHMGTEPVPIQQRLPHIPPQLAYLVMRSLAKDPSMRPDNARAFVAEIDEIERSLAAPPVIPKVVEPVVIPGQQKPPSIPTKPRAQQIAAVDPASKTPFFTTTKVTALVAMLVCALALGAVTVINHFRNLSAAKAAQMLATPPPVNTAVNNPPASIPAAVPDPTPVANPADQPATPPESKDPVPDPVVTPPQKTAPSRLPVQKVTPAKAPPAVSDPSTVPAQTSGSFPDPTPKQSADLSKPANDPWASYSGNTPPPSQNTGTYPATGNSQPNNPQMGNSQPGYPALNNQFPNSQAPNNSVPGNQGFNNPGGRGDILPPSVVSKVEPKYSQEAKSFRYSGTTVLSVVVDEHGLPGDIRVLRATGYGLDKQAVDAVSRWRFSPGLRNGAPIRYRVGVQVNFRYAGLFSFAKSSVFFQ
jgi:serine/threonine-protein kinase